MSMLFFGFLVITINYFFCVGNALLEEPKIVGGYQAGIHNVPYMAQVVQKGDQICGATIISQYWLVSAAHCFQNRKGLAVRTGSKYRSEGEIHGINKVFIPNNYKRETLNNDISLILLSTPIQFNRNQKPIKISSRPPQSGDKIVISGFGENEHKEYSSILKVAHVPVVNQKTCAHRHYPDVITNNMFCAGIGKTDSCQGDSGGPAVIANKLVGVVSWGQKCGSSYHPGVYTKVFSYRNWITKVTGIRL